MMKKLVNFIAIAVLVSACADSSDQELEEVLDQEIVPAETEDNIDPVVLDDTKVYDFMQLKELYSQNWEGEEIGNSVLDGKEVTISGDIFYVAKQFKYMNGESQLKGVKIQFRGSEFEDPDFGHDVECLFSLEDVEDVSTLSEGMNVTIKGMIEKQDIYIEPDLTYTVLSLTACELINE